jgi:hypothetical protein
MTLAAMSVFPSLAMWRRLLEYPSNEPATFEKGEGVVTRSVCVFGWNSETLPFPSIPASRDRLPARIAFPSTSKNYCYSNTRRCVVHKYKVPSHIDASTGPNPENKSTITLRILVIYSLSLLSSETFQDAA